MVVRKNNIIYQHGYDTVRIKYEQVFKYSVIPKGSDARDKVWNVYNSQKFPDQKLNKKCVNNIKRIISDNENKQTISRNNSRITKENFQGKKGKHNVTLTLSNVK